MKTIIVNECDVLNLPDVYTLNLNKQQPKHCLGCWNCWWTTPGKCVQKDLDDFYCAYVNADKAIFFSKLTQNFVSGNLKNLFDRMICLFLPYTLILKNGRTGHLPRYEKYPDIEFYHEGTFDNEECKNIFYDYIKFLFAQFYSKTVIIRPIEQYGREEH